MIDVNGYNLEELLAQGHLTSIYRATRRRDRTPVIVKLLTVEFPAPDQLGRIQREFDLVRVLAHPGIIKAHRTEKFGHSLAIVMEDFGGITLRQYIAQHSPALAGKLRIARRIAEILGEIHFNDIVHKDVNPNNILINPLTGEIKFIDFGHAIRSSGDHGDRSELHTPEHLEGTLAYIAPEQTGRMNRPVDYRSDYYSLGITLYELLLGRRPFESADSMEMVHQHIAVVPPLLHTQDTTIPVAVSRVVAKLIEKNAERRYQSSAGILHDLDDCLAALEAGRSLDDFVPGRHEIADRFSLPDRLYGREDDIRRLLDAYARSCAGTPGVVLVTGHSGIGKSALIDEIHRPLARSQGFFIAGKFDQFRRNIPYSALIQAFQSLLHQVLAASDERVAAWRERLLATLDGNAGVLMEVLPELAHILGPQPEVPPLGPHEAQNRFNLYFVNFVRVFAQAQHPLALFLDDLQWADIPSLNLVELLSADQGCAHLLIIGAYRQNEVAEGHPLLQSIARMTPSGSAVERIVLDKLTPDNVAELVADTLHCPREKSAALAALICRKADGNPFFVRQLLKSLHDDGLIGFDRMKREWAWDITRIEGIGITDNVVALMAGKIRKLPPAAQRLLKLAACIGNRFTLQQLAAVGADAATVADDFRPALDAGLALADDEACRFIHDRVQQAAYDLLNDEEKRRIHHQAGTLLLAATPAEKLDEQLFDIVNHFDLAIELATDPTFRRQLAELNLRAATKAKNAIAYEPALRYAECAQTLIQGAEEPALAFHILLERAECEHLSGRNEAAAARYRDALAAAPDGRAQSLAYEAMIHFHTNTGDFAQAYQTGREALRRYGVALPAGFVPPLFVADLARLKWRMRGRKIAALLELPECRDDNMRTALRLIGALLKAAYQIRPELCVASAVKAVNLSLVHGTTEDNAVAYLVFGGIFLGGVLGRHQAGYEFGQLALAMNERFANLKQRSEINFVAGYFTHFWLKPARETESYYRAAYESGLRTGDFFHLSCAACTLVESQFLRGVALPEVGRLGGEYLALMRRIGSSEHAGAITAVLRAIANLEGQTDNPASFGDARFDEAAFADQLGHYTLKHFAHFYFVNRMLALYLWRKIPEALAAARQSASYLKHSIAMLHTAEHHFLHALILCAAFETDGNRAHLRQAEKLLGKFERWAQLNPANFSHQALLVRAEIERLAKPGLGTGQLYNRAIRAADETGRLQYKALANELAGRFFVAADNTLAARGHLREARYGYALWGADGIADRLEYEFPQFVGRHDEEPLFGAVSGDGTVHTVSTTSATGSRGIGSLDLATIVKAMHAISGEIRLADLLRRMMEIIIENAGATKGAFLRIDKGALAVEAEGTAEGGVTVLDGAEPANHRLPLAVIHYVARVGESVVLNEARNDDRFGHDPYLATTKPPSLLCAPVLHSGHTIGIVYLENSLTGGAFTPAHLEMLGILSAQAAISIENSRLYASLEQRVAERTEELRCTNERLQQANAELERLTLTDALTQVANKRHFQQALEDEWRRAMRTGSTLSLMVVDIDCFKLYNDTYGHLEGDRCLKAVATALGTVVSRASDLLARFGGEEFAILLTATNAAHAELIAARLVECVRVLNIPHQTSTATDIVTISLGLAQAEPRQDSDPSELFTAADQALYRAKTGGRNRYSR